MVLLHTMMHTCIMLLICNYSLLVVYGREILELQSLNFELALSNYKYIAILFYDSSDNGIIMKDYWNEAAYIIDELSPDTEIAQINGNDKDIKELIGEYGLTVPTIKVFRRGVMADYRGPMTDANEIADFLYDDAKPSARSIDSLEMLQSIVKKATNSIVIGLFNEEDISDDDEGDTYSFDAWGQFQAAADALRGHATFYRIISKDVIASFELSTSQLPTIYLIAEDGSGLLQYFGEILEMNLSEWILRNSSPSIGELTLSTSSGELFATQFVSSQKLKFILFLDDIDSNSSQELVLLWTKVAEAYKKYALFSYMVKNALSDVADYFNVNVETDLPLLAAYDPLKDFKYKSQKLEAIHDVEILSSFVNGVINRTIKKLIKSEPVKDNSKVAVSSLVSKASKSSVVDAVGSNIVSIVSNPDVDVLVEVYTSQCVQCKKLQPTYDVLSRAVHGEKRILIVKIDGGANDIPDSWNVSKYPALLWFPSKDKPYENDEPVPRQYWRAGYSLHELFSFVVREGSFNIKSLKVATMEQLASLQQDEEKLRMQYEEEDRFAQRNEGRVVHDNLYLDYMAGEIVFDGKRWHLVLNVFSVISSFILLMTVIAIRSSSSNVNGSKKSHKE